MKENPVKDKSFDLAVEIVRLHRFLSNEKYEYVLSKQLLRSGTSVGANISEGVAARTKKEFSHRLSISYKEVRETRYWLNLLTSTGYLSEEKACMALKLCDEVARLLYVILKTASMPRP